MKSIPLTIPVLTALMLSVFAAAPASAQQSASRWSWSSPSAVMSDPWKFNAKVWGWFPWAPATIDTGGQSVHIAENVDVIYSALDIASMTEFELHKGPFGVFLSPIYYHGKHGGGLKGPEGGSRDFFLKEKVLFLQYGLSYDLGTYRLDETPGSPTVTVQPFVGATYIYDDVTLNVGPGTFLPGFEIVKPLVGHAPIVGVNTLWDVSDTWSFTLGGYYGGFHVGRLKQTYEIQAAAAYHFTMGGYASKFEVGYRHTYLDYSDRGLDIEVNITGPFIGLGVEF